MQGRQDNCTAVKGEKTPQKMPRGAAKRHWRKDDTAPKNNP